MGVKVHADFDGGNIKVVRAEDPGDIELAIRRDTASEFLQWFCFRVSGAKGAPLKMTLGNAREATYLEGWDGYQAVASTDRQRWQRVPTTWNGRELVIEHTPDGDLCWFAYFAPYPLERHEALLAFCQQHPDVAVETLGSTLDDYPLDLLTIGSGQTPLWIIARQHPGETMAEFWMEGFLHRLLDDDDPTSGALRRHATLYVVPNMNPDGSRRGHLRTNACGANLNREWQSPTRERSPEVLFVRQRMVETGVALSLDVHGDEALPYTFIAGPDGIPNLRPGQLDLVESFKADLAALSPDFQTEHGYPRAAPGQANLTMCTNWVAERFGCPAMTLEMPFKDTAGTPHRAEGWSPQRSAALGRSCLDALARILPQLPRDV